MIFKFFDYFKDEDDNDPLFIQLTRNILFFVLFVNIALLPLVTGIVGEGSRNPPALITLSITLTLELISLYYVLRRKIRMAKLVVPIALLAAVTVIALNSNGLKSTGIVGMPIILVIAAILLGRRTIYIIVPLAIGASTLIAFYDLSGQIKYVPAGTDDAFIIPILLVGCAGIIQL